MPAKLLPTAQILALLRETPTHITTLTTGLPTAQLHTAPPHDAWSANDLLAHLRSCADMWGTCIKTMLAEDTPTIRAINPVTWLKQTDYLTLPFAVSLQAFIAQRAELLSILEPLPPDAWWRRATVIGAGKPLERTVHFYAQWLATHERPHLKQLARIVDAWHS